MLERDDDLIGTLKLLREHRDEDRSERDMADIACAEAHVEDPLRATMVSSCPTEDAPASDCGRHRG